MAPNVFWIGVGAVPVAILGLLSGLSLSWHQLPIPQNIGSGALDALRRRLSLARLDLYVTVQVHIDLSFDLPLQTFSQGLELLLFLFEQMLELFIFLPVHIANASPLVLLVHLFVHSVHLLKRG